MKIKVFFIRLSILVLLLGVVDFGIGRVLDIIYLKPQNKVAYAYKHSNEEVLIFGSSRAARHYVPSIVTDSLNMECFNLGFNGRTLYHNYIIFKLITERYAPKLIVFDIFQPYLIENNSEIIENEYSDFTPLYYLSNVVRESMDKYDPTNKIKNISTMYRYNSKILNTANDILNKGDFNNRGYEPLSISKLDDDTKCALYEEKDIVIDKDKINIIDNIIQICKEKDIKLIFVSSPIYNHIESESVLYEFRDYLAAKDIIFLDYLNYNKLMSPKYFYDELHLNNEGAEIFTSLLVSNIKKKINECK